MTVFEPRTSGVGSDRSTNCATTTAQSSINVTANICSIHGMVFSYTVIFCSCSA